MKFTDIETTFSHEGEKTMCTLKATLSYDKIHTPVFKFDVNTDWGVLRKFGKNVDIEPGKDGKGRLTVTFKSVVSPKDGDKFDWELGERISASKARVRLNKWMLHVNREQWKVLMEYAAEAAKQVRVYEKMYQCERGYVNMIGIENACEGETDENK